MTSAYESSVVGSNYAPPAGSSFLMGVRAAFRGQPTFRVSGFCGRSLDVDCGVDSRLGPVYH